MQSCIPLLKICQNKKKSLYQWVTEDWKKKKQFIEELSYWKQSKTEICHIHKKSRELCPEPWVRAQGHQHSIGQIYVQGDTRKSGRTTPFPIIIIIIFICSDWTACNCAFCSRFTNCQWVARGLINSKLNLNHSSTWACSMLEHVFLNLSVQQIFKKLLWLINMLRMKSP